MWSAQGVWLLGPCIRPRKLGAVFIFYTPFEISPFACGMYIRTPAHGRTSGVSSLAFFVFVVNPILFSFEVCPAVAAPTAWHRVHLGAHRELLASMSHEAGGKTK